MPDNVTPFRRPPRRPMQPQQSGGLGFKTHRGKAVLSQSLTLLAFAFNAGYPFLLPPGFSAVGWILGLALGVAAAAIAYSNRGEATPWANTHHEHALRTLIIGFAILTLGSALTYIHGSLAVVSIFVQLAAALWAVVRSLIGLVLAMLRKAIPHPHGWLV